MHGDSRMRTRARPAARPARPASGPARGSAPVLAAAAALAFAVCRASAWNYVVKEATECSGSPWTNFTANPFGAGMDDTHSPLVPANWSSDKAIAACQDLCAADARCAGFEWYMNFKVGPQQLRECAFRASIGAIKTHAPGKGDCVLKDPLPPPPPKPFICPSAYTNCSECSFKAMCQTADTPGCCVWCNTTKGPAGAGKCVNHTQTCPN